MTLHHGRMIYNRKGTHLTVLPEKEWLSANTMQEELEQKDQLIVELKTQLSESLTLNEKLKKRTEPGIFKH